MKCLIVCKMYGQFLQAVELQSHSDYWLMCGHYLYGLGSNICSLASYRGPSPQGTNSESLIYVRALPALHSN